MKRALKRVLIAIVVLYLVMIALLLITSFLLPPEVRGILRTVLGVMLFPSLVLLPFSLLLGSRWLSIALVVPVIAWGLIYGSLLLPRTVDSSTDAQRLTVLTFNLQAATQDLQGLTAIIRNADADLVALQELSHDAAQYFETTLVDVYPYHALHPQDNAFHGQGVISKFPIQSDDYWRYEQLPAALAHMRTEVEFNGKLIAFYSVHPMPPVSFEQGLTIQSHSREIALLLDRVQADPLPVLIAGDFNMTHLTDEYEQVSKLYTDTFKEAGRPGLGFTFPAGRKIPLPPVIRLDYVFHSSHFKGIIAYPLMQSGTSDHLPVWAELALQTG